MTILVIDASVAAKWFLPEDGESHIEEATTLLRQYTRNEVGFAVPGLFWSECANILWKAVRRGRVSNETAQEALDELRSYKLSTMPTESLVREALMLAILFDRSVYDSVYVALAMALKTHLVTADKRLATALAAHLPVKLLGGV